MTKKLFLLSMVVLLFTAIVMPRLQIARAEEDMSAMVESAKTPADHEALAKMYDEQAAKASAQAAEHAKMAKSYRNVQRLSQSATHCERLADYYKSAAEDYKGLAITEREQTKAPQ